MKNKKKIIIPIIVLVLIGGIILISLYMNKDVKTTEQNGTRIFLFNKVGMANPSSTYCTALGYNISDGQGGGVCILPDGTKCEEWAFYRGKCGQRWSYCTLEGYDLQNLNETEGWGPDGSVCINKDTKKEVGNVFNLINQEFTLQNNLNP